MPTLWRLKTAKINLKRIRNKLSNNEISKVQFAKIFKSRLKIIVFLNFFQSENNQ